ncbi:MAG: efflux RND transporter permease subunit [Deltaproteobacteria bacterium]|nr:efflux RND transporter permease subunit [Deltaproteobacteria bacterium]
MKLSEVCVRRPVFATMLVGVLVVVGLASYYGLGVDLFPNIDLPIVTVTTTLKSASPEEIETSLTKPIEEAVNTVSGIDELRSTSREGVSQVVIRFLLERNGEEAAQDVRDRVATIVKKFPEGTDPPVIVKFDIDAAPVMTISVSGSRDLREITKIADDRIKQNLETVNGVGAVSIVGGRRRAVNIYVNPSRMEALGLTVPQVQAALAAQNLEIPGGRVDTGTRELVLRTMGRMPSVEDFQRLIVANINGRPVMVRDIGWVENGQEEPRSLARFDGRPSVNLVIQKQSGTNTIDVIRKVKERIAAIGKTLPADIRIDPIRDQSTFILRSIREVKTHLILGGILTSLVVLLFMGNWRSTLIAAVAIPSSIVATFTIMRVLGFTLNNITFLALTLSVGIVIDDAIVVLENIFRHVEEEGVPPRDAAVEATAEIGLAVSATTLSLVVIFLPVAFMSGIVGRFFHSYGITVAFAILFSWFVSFTLTPMLSSRFLKVSRRKGNGRAVASSKENRFYRAVSDGYLAVLRKSLAHRWVVAAVTVLVIFSMVPLARVVAKDFLPFDDQSEFEIFIQTPEGYSLESADAVFREVEGDVRKVRGVKHLLTQVGDVAEGDVTQGTIYVRTVDLKERKYSQFDVMKDVRRALAKYPSLRVSVQNISAIGRGGGIRQTPVSFVLRGPDLARLESYSSRITDEMRKIKGFVDVDTSLSNRKPEVRVHVDRKKASDLGVQVQNVAASLNVFVGGEKVTKYREGADQYDVWLRADLPFRSSLPEVSNLPVPSSRLGKVRIRDVAGLLPSLGPAQIDRATRERQVTITSNLDGLALGTATERVKAIVGRMELPPGYRIEFFGRAKTMQETLASFLVALLLSIVFMYMVLAAQFESFLHPVSIMLALPISIPFALLSLLLLGESLNIYSILGLFLLFGIVKKNGILQVDYTNTLRARGMGRDEAILGANSARLRPILMTTVTLIAAMIPIALGKGPGAASRASLAKVIIGGQALSLLLTLIVTPVAYSLFDDLGNLSFLRGWRKRFERKEDRFWRKIKFWHRARQKQRRRRRDRTAT